jgi:hypothetical protein
MNIFKAFAQVQMSAATWQLEVRALLFETAYLKFKRIGAGAM